MARYIPLKVTDEDRENITKRKNGEGVKEGLFGNIELLRRLLEISPKMKTNTDLMQLLRLNRKLDAIEGEKEPVLEIAQDDYGWLTKMLEHDQMGTYGPPMLRRIGELLESVTEAKSELSDKPRLVKEQG